MKADGRTRLFCTKTLPCDVIDSFSVVVMNGYKDAAKREYESQGYRVTQGGR